MPDRLGASHADGDGGLRAGGRGSRPEGHHRRRRRRRPSARHDCIADHRARAGRAGRKPRAEGSGLAAVDRADARRRAGGNAGDWQARRDQRRAACRGDPRDVTCRPSCEARQVPRGPDGARQAGHARMSAAPILPGATIGVLGSGQLGRMFALAARRLGYRIHIFSPERDTPAGQVADLEVVAPYDDLEAVAMFGGGVDVVTFEFENIPAATAEAAAAFAPVRPSGAALHVAQQRAREKGYLADRGFPVTPFAHIRSDADLDAALETIGTPAVLKTASFGYDGKGQSRVASAKAARAAWTVLGKREAVLEQFIPFEREVSTIVARGVSGWIASYGLIENSHANHILDVSVHPASVLPEV